MSTAYIARAEPESSSALLNDGDVKGVGESEQILGLEPGGCGFPCESHRLVICSQLSGDLLSIAAARGDRRRLHFIFFFFSAVTAPVYRRALARRVVNLSAAALSSLLFLPRGRAPRFLLAQCDYAPPPPSQLADEVSARVVATGEKSVVLYEQGCVPELNFT